MRNLRGRGRWLIPFVVATGLVAGIVVLLVSVWPGTPDAFPARSNGMGARLVVGDVYSFMAAHPDRDVRLAQADALIAPGSARVAVTVSACGDARFATLKGWDEVAAACAPFQPVRGAELRGHRTGGPLDGIVLTVVALEPGMVVIEGVAVTHGGHTERTGTPITLEVTAH